jgi:hypothetical protein
MNDIENQVNQLLDSESGMLRRWSERKDRLDLYQTALGWPLVTTPLDGFGTPATWQQDFGKTKSETLFRALLDVSDSWSAFYVKDHDDAYGEIAWVEQRLNIERIHPRVLSNFDSDPADEGGHTYLGLFIGTPEDSILFVYATEVFRISLFGRMKVAVPEALARSTKPAN